MKTKADCIFCKIVAGTAPSAKVYEDDHTLAFMDLMPVSRGHTLVIPKSHYENLFEIEAPLLAAVADVSHKLAPAIQSAFEPDGLRIFQLNGAAAGQTVFHYHMHLLPKFADQEDRFLERVMAGEGELEAAATAIKAVLAGLP